MKKTRWIAMLLALALALSLAVPAWAEEGQEPGNEPGNEPGEPVVLTSADIPDPALMAAIRDALALEEGEDLTQEALDTLTALDLRGTAVKDPTGLTLAKNLHYNVILPAIDPDVERVLRGKLNQDGPLTWRIMRTARDLDLTGVEFQSLDGLQWASTARSLYIDSAAEGAVDDDMMDLIVSQMPYLSQVQLDNLGLTRVPNFAGKQYITRLDLAGDPIADLSPVLELPALSRLVIRDNTAATDLGVLGTLDEPLSAALEKDAPVLYCLGTLDMSGTCPTAEDLAAIGKLNLDVLKLSDVTVEDFTFLPKGLNTLYLDRTGLTDLSVLDTSYSTLSLAGNGLTSLAGVPKASHLFVQDNHITDLTPLWEHTISDLNVDNNDLTTLAGLSGQVTSLRARNNRIASLNGMSGMKVRYLYLDHNDISDLSGLDEVMDPPTRTVNGVTVTEDAIVKLDGNRVDVEAWKPVVDQWKSEHIAVSLKDQQAEAASPVAPPATIGEAEVTTAILLSAKSATRGSLVTVRAICENTGTADLGEHTFEVLYTPAGGVALTDDPVTEAPQATSLKSDGLAAGESEEIVFTFKIPAGYDKNDPIRFVTKITVDETDRSTGAAALGVYYAELSAPDSAYAGRALRVYGEATVGSHVAIVDQDGETLVETDMAANNRWFTATIPADKVTGDLTGLQAVVTKGEERHESALVPIDVNTTDVFFDHSSIVGPTGKEYGPTNTYVGFPTLIASLDAHMIGPALVPKLWLGNDGAVEDVRFTFAGKTVPAVAVTEGEKTVYTVNAEGEENFNRWTATGVQKMTATVTQAGGKTHTFTVAQFTVLIDPSGTVYDYDGVTPLEGVTVTLQEKVGEEWVDWIAEPYMQTNPVVTGADGRYGWDTPEGTYRVIMEKKDYYRKVIETYVPKSAPEGAGAIPLVVAPAHTEVDAVLEPVPLTGGAWEENAVACTLTVTQPSDKMVFCAFYDEDGAMLECRMNAAAGRDTLAVDQVPGAVSAKFILLGKGTWKPVCEALEVTAPKADGGETAD